MTTDTHEKIKLTLGVIAAQQGGYGLGDPWRFSDESVVAVLPITREIEKERSYITFTETGTFFHVTETGKVNEVVVENRGGTAVFLRAGELLVGGTQERAIVDSHIVEPGEKVRLPVVCVHASRGLRTGAKMRPGGYTPRPLYSSLANLRDRERSRIGRPVDVSSQEEVRRARSRYITAAANMQREAWSSISHYTSCLYASPSYTARAGEPRAAVAPSDDLLQAVGRFSRAIQDVIAKVPAVDNQVGLATVGMEGIIAFECYDLKPSWSAVREGAVKQQGEDLSKVIEDVDQVFRYEPGNAGRALRALLTSALEAERTGGNGTWGTYSLKSARYVGEATVHQDELIHVYLVRRGS